MQRLGEQPPRRKKKKKKKRTEQIDSRSRGGGMQSKACSLFLCLMYSTWGSGSLCADKMLSAPECCFRNPAYVLFFMCFIFNIFAFAAIYSWKGTFIYIFSRYRIIAQRGRFTKEFFFISMPCFILFCGIKKQHARRCSFP